MRSRKYGWLKALAGGLVMLQYVACDPATNTTIVLSAVLGAGLTSLFGYLGLRYLARS